MTQACSKVLAHRRPLLALALVAALLAAAAVALSPARAATATATTWTLGLALRDADNDGVYQKGDTPELLVTIEASIQPDADDQSNGGVTNAAVNGAKLTFDPSTRLTISGGQGIEFQTGTNTQVNRLNGAALNAKAPVSGTPMTFTCVPKDSNRDDTADVVGSSGSSPAKATCEIRTGITISIPAVLENMTYTISGKVQLADITGANDANDDVTATWMEDDGANEDDSTVRDRTANSDKLAVAERTNNNASVSFKIGVQPTIAVGGVRLTPAKVCDATGKVGASSLPAAQRNKACKDTIPVGHETQYTLSILNSEGNGVVNGQVAAIVATLVRTGEGRGTATFSNCPGATDGRASCSPTPLTDSTYDTSGATFKIKAPSTPGAATLSIQVLASAGGSFIASGTPRDLVFVGPAKTITLSDPVSTVLNRNSDEADAAGASVGASLANRSKGTDSITLSLSAVDALGNTASHPSQNYTYEITGPDGRRINDDAKITIEAGQKATSGTDAQVTSKGKVLIDVTAPASAPLATGMYTATVKRTAQGLSATKMFRVVGPADSDGLTIEVGDASAAIGSSVAITATVNDADGNPVPDGTSVTFTASNADGSNNDLVILPGGSDNKTGAATTDDGTATISGTVVGNGVVILIATTPTGTGTASDTGEIDTSSDAQAISATPTSCLSKTDVGDYTTWTCTQTGNADAVFSVLRNRGADALYLRSVGRWVRYATDAAGGPIPGSTSNFTIRQYDTLFIGG